MKENKVEFIVPESLNGKRADLIISSLLSDISRSKVKAWIEGGHILVNGLSVSPRKKLLTGENIIVCFQPDAKELQFEPENLDLDIIYKDNDIAVINKPAGLVVHPAEGNWSGTLLNGLLHHFPLNRSLPRAGIVHRLDKDTSGLLVIALNNFSQQELVKQLQNKTVYREYRALVWGDIANPGTINEPIGRHPKNRIKMAVNNINGKNSVTHFEVIENFTYHTYIKCILETGRTHQIRVHLQFNKTPIVGDQIYGYKKIISIKNSSSEHISKVINFGRQALHAKKLGLVHPKTNLKMSWNTKIPNDFMSLLKSASKLNTQQKINIDHNDEQNYENYADSHDDFHNYEIDDD